MGIKTFKPTSPARRFYSVSDFKEISKVAPERSLLEKQSATGGRYCFSICAALAISL